MKNIGPLIINIDDITLSKNEKLVIKHDLIGGIILFSHNYSSKEQLIDLINEIKSIKNNIYICIDHEGGRVQRLLDDFTHLPSLESISNINDKVLAKDIAFLKFLNLNFLNFISWLSLTDQSFNSERNLLISL